jgi:hypothetical protein
MVFIVTRPSWSWSYGSWIYNYLCNRCLLPLTLWVRIPLKQSVLDTTLCDKVCQWLAAGRWFSLGTPVSSTNKTDCHNVTEILLKVALNTIAPSSTLHNTKRKKKIRNRWKYRFQLGTSTENLIGLNNAWFITIDICHHDFQYLKNQPYKN